MNKRQAKLIAQLITASSNAQADFVSYINELDEKESNMVEDALAEPGWRILEKHGFKNPPGIPEIIAYAKSKY